MPRVAPKWYDLGLVLDIQPFVLAGISHEQEPANRPREMFTKWLQGSPGTGSQARTWQSVLDAVGTICGTEAVEDIRTDVQTLKIPTAGLFNISNELYLLQGYQVTQGNGFLLVYSSVQLYITIFSRPMPPCGHP